MKQHVIPNCYLKAWCDPCTPLGQEPYIWRISKDGTTRKNKSPQKSFTATDRYTVTLPDGQRSLVLENTLAGLENEFVQVRQRIMSREELNTQDKVTLCLFAAALHSRTIRAGDNLRNSLQQVHQMVTSLENQYSVEPDLSRQTGSMVETAPQDMVVFSLEIETPLYMAMEMSVFVTDDNVGFITSDTPCVWFNPKAHTFPPFYRSPGLAQEDIEVTLPLTPHHLLFISHRKHPPYIDVGRQAVDEANRLARAHCAQEFVSWKGETRPHWFDLGEKPADAWENTAAGKKALRQQAEWEEELKKWKSQTANK
jgi:hypothetical protein